MKQLLLSEVVQPGPQFARSVNIERDARADALKGYLPTGRALDVLRRFAAALKDASLTRAWSITGPYGSGKSALALLLNCLAGPNDDKTRDEALAIVSSVDKVLAVELRAALDALTGEGGFLRAAVTAQREPIERTIVRSLMVALDRFDGAPRRSAALVKEAEKLLAAPLPPARAVADLVQGAAALAPVLLLIDEFGKNLEFFADRPGDGDLFALQEIIERSSSASGSPVFVITLQHLAFEDYAASATASQRREWAKVQGRFEDVPFADSPAEVLQLVARVFRRLDGADEAVLEAIDRWADAQYKVVEQMGLGDRIPGPSTLAACYPLHPLALAVLPELCSRYGQRERTLFSFLARPEPHSVASFLGEQTISPRRMPVVGVEQVFDYFVAMSGAAVASADGASRWVEIDTRIKETQGLSDDAIRVMKVVGVLNLVSRGGSVRASREALGYAAGDVDLDAELELLQARGLLVHRAFADEFRIWQGSDFDLHGAIEDARRRLALEPLARVCERALPLSPVVAARHSQDKGILRFFDRTYVDASGLGRAPSADADGILVYVLDDTPAGEVSDRLSDRRPTILVYTTQVGAVAGAARDAAAVAEVLASNDSLAKDWVARRELHERAALTAERFREAFSTAFALDGEGVVVLRDDGSPIDLRGGRTWSSLLSGICDAVYRSAPTVRNEMIARRELSSQAARARRDLLVAMIERAGLEHLGIEGYGPERAILESIVVHSGMYRSVGGVWAFAPPRRGSDYSPAWQVIETFFSSSESEPVTLEALWNALKSPPIGLPEGLIPVLVTVALLVHADDAAVYQDGTFQPVFGAELIERMIKAPKRFAVKYFATRGPRARVLRALALRLPKGLPAASRNASIVRVVAPLVRSALNLPEYSRRTSALDEQSKAVRDALTTATEPDVLVFSALPKAVGLRGFTPTGQVTLEKASKFADLVMDALARLEDVYPSLIRSIANSVAAGFGRPAPARLDEVRADVMVRSAGLIDKVIEPRLRSFLLAAADAHLDDQDWIENIAMNVVERPPRTWRDEDRQGFELRLDELLSAYRRVEILNLEHLNAHPNGARARQVVVTTPEGNVSESVVWLDDAAAEAVEELLATALESASVLVGRRAPETLLAVLAERVVSAGAAWSDDRQHVILKEVRRRHA